MELRDYQIDIVIAARKSVSNGNKRIIIHAATGAGKTIIASHIISKAVEKDKKVLFLANRRELIKQSSKKLDEYGVKHGVIMSGIESELQERVQIASMQTYIRRMNFDDQIVNPWFHNADLIIVDECHSSISPSYQKILQRYDDSVVTIGLSATPARADQRGLGEYYSDIVSVIGMKQLIKQGFLVQPRYFSATKPDLEKISIQMGDYNKKELGKRMNQKKLVGDILENWTRVSPGRQTIIFAVNVAHSISIKTEFEKHGIKIEHMDAKTPSDERDAIFRDFETGDIQVITNVGILGEGMDFPWVKTIVLARPTKSLPLYLQMAGRGGRPYKDKKDFYIIDHGRCVEAHGFIEDAISWSLDGKEIAWKKSAPREKEAKSVKCKVCHEIFKGLSVCPTCQTPLKTFGKQIDTVDAELKEIKPQTRNRKDDKIKKRQVYGAILWHCNKKGYSNGWAAHKYRGYYNVWPNAHKGCPSIKPETPEIKNILQHILIVSAKRYAKQKRMAA